MQNFLFLLCVPIVLTGAVQFGPARAYLGNQVGNSENYKQSELKTLSNAKKHTSGYLRTDTYDWLRDSWLQAQVLPIGLCFRDGVKEGSAQLTEVMINADSVLRTSQIYNSSDCSGTFSSATYLQPTAEVRNPFQVLITHEEKLEVALQLTHSYNNGIIVTSFYSPDGCTGTAAQYDILPTYNPCAVYADYAGMFSCDMKGEVIILEKFELTAAETSNYPFCDPALYLSTTKQPFACTDQRATPLIPGATKSAESSAPVFQTVQCFTAPISPFEKAAADAMMWANAPDEEE